MYGDQFGEFVCGYRGLRGYRSFSIDDGNDNEEVRRAIRLISKITTLHVQHTFLYISLPSLHDYLEKSSHGTFYGGRKHTTMNFFFLILNLDSVPKNSIPGRFTFIWHCIRVETIFIAIIPTHLIKCRQILLELNSYENKREEKKILLSLVKILHKMWNCCCRRRILKSPLLFREVAYAKLPIRTNP